MIIVCLYPRGSAPSLRYRLELVLNTNETEYISFLSNKSWGRLYDGMDFKLFLSLVLDSITFCFSVFRIPRNSKVIIHREIAPMKLPIFEWYLVKVKRSRIIFDFDDAIWLDNRNQFSIGLKRYSKLEYLIAKSDLILAGNKFLADYARKFNDRVLIFPTVVDTNYHARVKVPRDSILTIGWTGSHSTLKYLYLIEDVLARLKGKYEFKLLVICNERPVFKDLDFEFIQWSEAKEIEDLSRLDIGLMPLQDDIWSKGKCGFKAIQYGSMGIPTILSPVGVNKEIVIEGITGYFALNDIDWFDKLESIIANPSHRIKMGLEARKRICAEYSSHVWSDIINFSIDNV